MEIGDKFIRTQDLQEAMAEGDRGIVRDKMRLGARQNRLDLVMARTTAPHLLEGQRKYERKLEEQMDELVNSKEWDKFVDVHELQHWWEYQSGRFPHHLDFISEDNWEEYCQDQIEGEYGELPGVLVIDWTATANAMRQDYTEITLPASGKVYLVRS